MRSRVLLVLVTMIAAAVLLMPVSSAGADGGGTPRGKATLRNLQTGESILLPVAVQSESMGNGHHADSFEVGIPHRYLSASKGGSTRPALQLYGGIEPLNDKSDSRYDPTYSVLLTLKQTYWETTTSEGHRAVSVDYYDGKWDTYDSSVTWSNAKLRAGCWGPFVINGSGTCSNQQDQLIGNPTSGSWYRETPTWAGKYVDVSGSF